MTSIRELWIDGFGCLRTTREPFRFARDRLTLFLDENEAGKTTLQMALLASFYGVETDRRLLTTSIRAHQNHWCPLTGAPFGTRLRLHHDQRHLEVRWDFANAGDLHVIDLDTNRDVTGELCPGGDGLELGRRLLGLTLGEFLKTCLVQQGDLARVGDAEGLDSLVQRAADSQAGDMTVARAQDKLRALLRNYPEAVMLKGGGLLDNEIRRLEEDAESTRHKLAELEAERAAIADQDAEFRRVAEQRNRLAGEVAKLEYLAQVAEHDELKDQIEQTEKKRAALAELEVEREELSGLEGFPVERAGQLKKWQLERQGLLRDAEQAERTVAEIRRNALEPARRELEALGRLASVTQDQIHDVTELLGKTRDFEARERRLLEAIRREEEQLASQGASFEELDRLEERFASLEPEDGEFLTDHESIADRAGREVEEAKRRSLEATMQVDRIADERQRRREAARRRVLIGTVVAAAGVAAGGLLLLLSTAAGVAVGLVAVAAGGSLVLIGQKASSAAGSHCSDELAEARLQLSQLEVRRGELDAEQREREARLKGLAKAFGYEQREVLIEDYRSLDDLRRLCGNLSHLRDRERESAEEREELEGQVGAQFEAYEAHRPLGVALSGALEALQRRMARAVRRRQQIDELTHKVEGEVARRDAWRQKAEDLTAKLRDLLAEAGLGEVEFVNEAIDVFNERLEQYQRLRQFTDVLLPQARANLAKASDVETWEADLQRLHRAIATQREERPGLVSLEVTERSAEYRRQLDDVRARLDELKTRAHEVGRRVVDILRRWHGERPGLEEALAKRHRQLERARRHNAALEMAVRVLDEIGREVHGRWAEELNRSTSQLLGRIAPTLRDLKFDSRLRFGVRRRVGDTTVHSSEITPMLSAGTWDQLYLVVRLGLAEFISQRGCGGLVLLDDPFARFDDRRFEQAMRVLAELARGRHQIVLFSCQHQRFNWLRARDPQWFDSHIARRKVRG